MTNDDDILQAGAAMPTQSQTPPPSGNYLSPQQRMQMGQYANALMTNQGGPPVHTMGAGLGEMAKAAMGGYMMNQAYPQGSGGGGGLNLGSLFGSGHPMATGDDQPMQLASAGGGQPSSIFSGLFGGGGS